MNKAGDLWYVHRFAKGELRVDGWKSQWRLDLERRMAEEALKPRPTVKAKQLKAIRPIKAAKEKHNVYRTHQFMSRYCDVCNTAIRHDNKTGRCIKHKLKRPQALAIHYKCGACDKPIRKTEYGVCKKCFTKYRRRIEQNHPRCKECNVIIRANTRWGLCVKHAKPKNNEAYNEMKKQRRALRRAA